MVCVVLAVERLKTQNSIDFFFFLTGINPDNCLVVSWQMVINPANIWSQITLSETAKQSLFSLKRYCFVFRLIFGAYRNVSKMMKKIILSCLPDFVASSFSCSLLLSRFSHLLPDCYACQKQ